MRGREGGGGYCRAPRSRRRPSELTCSILGDSGHFPARWKRRKSIRKRQRHRRLIVIVKASAQAEA